MKVFVLASFLAAAAANAASTSITVPAGYEIVEGNSATIAPFGVGEGISVRYQQVYDAAQFEGTMPNGGLITEIDFRVDGPLGHGFASDLRDVQINLSTSANAPDSLIPIFSANVGVDDTIVVGRGQLLISGTGFGNIGIPSPLDVRILLISPFLYRPEAGNLLLDVRTYQGGFQIPPFDSADVNGDPISVVVAASVLHLVARILPRD
jgi:hypothetical protein